MPRPRPGAPRFAGDILARNQRKDFMRTTSWLLTSSLCAAISFGVVSCQSTGGGRPSSSAGETEKQPPAGARVAELRAKLRDPDMSVRLKAVEELGPMAESSPEAVDALMEAVSDSDPMVRRFVAYGLSDVKAPSAAVIVALTKLLRDAELEPRQAAALALSKLAPRVEADSVRDLAAALAAATADKDEMVRTSALMAVGALGAPGALQVPAVKAALERALKDPNAQIREAASSSIGQLGPGVPGTVALLIKALADPVHDVRKHAVVALEKMGPEAAPATKALARQLRGKEIYLRVFAADALAAIGPGARAALPELKALVKRGWKGLEKSQEMEAKQLPHAVAKAIASIEGKPAPKEAAAAPAPPPEPAASAPVKVSTGKAVVKGHISDANTGDFDLVDGIAWPAGSRHTVVYVVSKPIASSAIAASPCPMTMARALTVVRNAGWIELTMDPAGKSDYFGAGAAFGGSGRESEVGGNYWSSTLKKAAGRVSGTVEHEGKKAAFEFDLPVSSPKAAEVSESDRMAGAQAGANTPAPTAQAMVAAYRAAHAAALKKDWNALLGALGFDAKVTAAIRKLPGIDADLAVFADRFLKPGTAGETDVREGHGYVGGEGVNSKGAKFLNYYFWTTCEGKVVLHMIGENPQ